jgi:hypothetical protein
VRNSTINDYNYVLIDQLSIHLQRSSKLCTIQCEMYLPEVSKLVWIILSANYKLIESNFFEIIHQGFWEYAMAAILSRCPRGLLSIESFVICIDKSAGTVSKAKTFLLVHND